MWKITAAFLLFALLAVNGENEVKKPKGMNNFLLFLCLFEL